MFFIVLETIVQNIITHGEIETEMILKYQNIFYKIRILKVDTLLASLSFVFFLYFGITVGYFYYLSP